MAIHIFFGGKGGTGKTLTAFINTLYHIEHMKSVLVIDLNFHNADLSVLLLPLAQRLQQNETPLSSTGFGVLPFYNHVNKISLLVRPDPSGDFFGKIPHGIEGVYKRLEDILVQIEAYVYEQGFNFPDTIIVDTPLHLSNLLPLDEANVNFSAYTHINRHEIILWFIWTLSTANRISEIIAVDKALRWFAENAGLKLPNNLVHVINPYVMTRPHSIINAWPQSDIPLKSLIKLLNDDEPSDAIPFQQLCRLISAGASHYKGDNFEIFIEHIVDSVRWRGKKPSFREQLENKGVRPQNLFPIPYFRHDLIGYTEALDYNKEYTFDELKQRLGKIYDAFEKFMKHWHIED